MAITIGIVALVVICIVLASRGRSASGTRAGSTGFHWFGDGAPTRAAAASTAAAEEVTAAAAAETTRAPARAGALVCSPLGSRNYLMKNPHATW
jgi:hypothetical protein